MKFEQAANRYHTFWLWPVYIEDLTLLRLVKAELLLKTNAFLMSWHQEFLPCAFPQKS